MNNNIVLFDEPYSADKVAEGMAVSWAILYGACDKCEHLNQCESESNFNFPQNSPCMIRKSTIVKEMEKCMERND